MSTSVTFNGVSYTVPAIADASWGNNVSNYLIAISTGCLQKTGGSFTLSAEVDFGATFGLKTAYYKSKGTTVSSTGVLRLANAELVAWKNAAGNADLGLTVNSSNSLQFNGADIPFISLGAANTVLNVNAGATALQYTLLANANIASAAAIAVNKLAALTASRAVVTDASGFVSAATTTSTEIGYVNGVTSAIQTQLNAKEPTITVLTVAKGGTNSGTALNNNRVIQSSAGAIVEAAAITASRALVSDANGIPVAATTTSTEIGYVNGVTSAIQTQLDAKQLRSTLTTKGDLYVATASNVVARQGVGADNTVLTAASGQTNGMTWGLIANANIASAAAIAVNKLAALSTSVAVATDGSGFLTTVATTATELGYVAGVTSAIQTQINALQSRSTLTTKGDLYVATASATVARLAVGSDGKVLSADSGQTTGLNWVSPLTNPMTTAGDLIVGGVAGAATRLAIGASQTYLRSDGSSEAWIGGIANGSDADTTLTVSSSRIQQVTPTANRTYTLPTTSVLKGDIFRISNLSSVSSTDPRILVNASGGSLVRTIWSLTSAEVIALQDTPTTSSHWMCLSPAETSWTPFTPTGSWNTNVTYTGYYKRSSTNMHLYMKVACSGAPNSAALTINIPSSWTIDTTPLGATDFEQPFVGTTTVSDNGASSYNGIVAYLSTTAIAPKVVGTASTYGGQLGVDQTTPITFGNTDIVIVACIIPISGWTATGG